MALGIEGIQPAPTALKVAYGTSFPSPRAVVSGGGGVSAGNANAPAPADTRLGQDPGADRPTVGQTVSDVNTRMERENRAVRFKFDEEANRVQVQIVDANRQRVIRSMPTDEMLNLATRLRELSGVGVMVDQWR